MPRDITHIILADEAAKTIKSKEISDNLDAFHMGCVADDSFFYSLSPQLSTRLHGGLGDDTRAVALEMMDQLKNEKNPTKAAEKKAQNIETEKARVLARKKQLEAEAKKVLAPKTSNLQAVTPDMDKDTKISIREDNKEITDTLEQQITERIKKVRSGRE